MKTIIILTTIFLIWRAWRGLKTLWDFANGKGLEDTK